MKQSLQWKYKGIFLLIEIKSFLRGISIYDSVFNLNIENCVKTFK